MNGKTRPVGPTKWAPATGGPSSKPGESGTPATRVIAGGETAKETFHTTQCVESATYTSVPRTARSRSWAPSLLTAGRQSHRLGFAAWRVPTRVVTLKGGVVLTDRIAQRSAMIRFPPESTIEKRRLKRAVAPGPSSVPRALSDPAMVLTAPVASTIAGSLSALG